MCKNNEYFVIIRLLEIKYRVNSKKVLRLNDNLENILHISQYQYFIFSIHSR